MAKKRKILESDLYPPVREYLLRNGYTVRGEVLDCDIAAVKGADLVIIELKRGFTTELLIQAADRQRIADSVYVCMPRPECGPRDKRWRGIQHLLRRLELGLMLVDVAGDPPVVEIAFHPVPFSRRRKAKVRRAVLREIEGRSGDYNRGGSCGRRLVTAYREKAIHVACCLEAGPLSPRELRAMGTCPRTQSILYHNVYEWFERLGRGVYGLSALGREEIGEYPELLARYRRKVEESSGDAGSRAS